MKKSKHYYVHRRIDADKNIKNYAHLAILINTKYY